MGDPVLAAEILLRELALQLRYRKFAVFADEFAVEVDFAAAVFFALDQHLIPMDGRLVAVVGFIVALTRSEVDRAGDFFIEEGVLHRVKHHRVDADRPFADIARARIGVENAIEFGGVVLGSGFDDLAVS